MKKNSVIKAILFMFLVYVLLSWIIPIGAFSQGSFNKGTTNPVGIMDMFVYPISAFITSEFAVIGIVVLLIGGLYGVMNKTGVYQKIVEGTVKKFSGKEKIFLIISIIIFALLASLTTLTLPLIIMVPFFVAVILSLGYNRMTALLSTFGAILVGNMGSILGCRYNYAIGIKVTDNMIAKIVLFVLLVSILAIFVIKTSKLQKAETKKGRKSSKKEEVVSESLEIPLYKKVEESKKSSIPLVIILILTLVIALVAMFNWEVALGFKQTIFTEWYNDLIATKVNGYPLFKNLIGSISSFGYWSNFELSMLLIIAIITIGFVYNLKVRETCEAVVDGMKELLPVAIVAVLANLLLSTDITILNNSYKLYYMPQTLLATIYDFFFKIAESFNFIIIIVVTAIGSIVNGDIYYLLSGLYDPATTLYAKNLKEFVYIVQVIHGFIMMIVPTSVGLVIGLKYLNVSLKEWFKENWKLLLGLLVASLIVIAVVALI